MRAARLVWILASVAKLHATGDIPQLVEKVRSGTTRAKEGAAGALVILTYFTYFVEVARVGHHHPSVSFCASGKPRLGILGSKGYMMDDKSTYDSSASWPVSRLLPPALGLLRCAAHILHEGLLERGVAKVDEELGGALVQPERDLEITAINDLLRRLIEAHEERILRRGGQRHREQRYRERGHPIVSRQDGPCRGAPRLA